MKTYKGLQVPENTEAPSREDYLEAQHERCVTMRICMTSNEYVCDNCLFYRANLDQFIEWMKERDEVLELRSEDD